MLVEGLFSYLSGNAGLQAFVGTGTAADVYPVNIPQELLIAAGKGAVAMRQVHGSEFITLDGKGETPEQLWEFESVALDLKTAKQLAEALLKALQGFAGTMGSTTVLGVFVQSSGRDGYDMERLHFFVQQDFKIWYRRT
jgi:hypothetical protein